MELAYVANYAGDQVAAARAAGFKNANKQASAIHNRPRVKAAIEEKQKELIKESGRDLGKAVTLTRNDIINGLHTEAKDAESDSARVSAWSKLADIYMPKGKDIDFSGWYDEELEAFILRGELPKRFFPTPEVNGPRADDHGKPSDNPTNPHRPAAVSSQGPKSPARKKPRKATRTKRS